MRRVELKILVAGKQMPILSQKPVVFTNGCFDILHPGHVSYLQAARHMGRTLIVGLNSDESIRKLKGPNRPVNAWVDRAWVLAGLESVDWVIQMGETNVPLLHLLKPQVWCKGGGYTMETLNPAEVAAARELGIEIQLLPAVEGHSTTKLIEKLSNT